MNNHFTQKPATEIKPLSIRQLAIGLAFAIMISSLLAVLILHRESNRELKVYVGQLPSIVKPAHASAAGSYAPNQVQATSMSFNIPRSALPKQTQTKITLTK